jgi:mannose-6-phosphate isomerase-like protein (cupin superfamily)
MVKINWRSKIPTIVHNAGVDWSLLRGQSLKNPKDPFSCMQGMMYVARACLQPSLSYHAHAHDDHEEVYYIISGSGEIEIDEEIQPIRDGDIIYIGVNQVHSIRNTGSETIEFLAFAAQTQAAK